HSIDNGWKHDLTYKKIVLKRKHIGSILYFCNNFVFSESISNKIIENFLFIQEMGPTFIFRNNTRDKFIDILRFIRFDKKTIVKHVIKYENISIDKQLFPIKARCPYIKTKYIINGFLYLVYHLEKKDTKTILVESIRANKIELVKLTKGCKITLSSSLRYKSGNCILIIYQSKPKTTVLLLITKHTFVKVKNDYKRVPETIRLS
ncbi:piggyBac transposable element-derived protein 4-like, partial [Vespula squamosa]